MMRTCLVLALLSLAFSAVSCGGGAPYSPRNEILPRATFELDCPAEQLNIRCLNESCALAGARGCGRRGTYMWTQGGYILNGTSESGSDKTP